MVSWRGCCCFHGTGIPCYLYKRIRFVSRGLCGKVCSFINKSIRAELELQNFRIIIFETLCVTWCLRSLIADLRTKRNVRDIDVLGHTKASNVGLYRIFACWEMMFLFNSIVLIRLSQVETAESIIWWMLTDALDKVLQDVFSVPGVDCSVWKLPSFLV